MMQYHNPRKRTVAAYKLTGRNYMKKRYRIQVRDKATGKTLHCILRVPWLESIGNFNPMFCRYRGKRCLVKSDAGDLSDPFRREENYLAALYIEVTL